MSNAPLAMHNNEHSSHGAWYLEEEEDDNTLIPDDGSKKGSFVPLNKQCLNEHNSSNSENGGDVDVWDAFSDENSHEDESARLDSGDNGHFHDKNKKQNNKLLGTKETKQVGRLRICMLLVLVTVTMAASVAVYWYSRKTEVDEFENEFAGQGFKVISGFEQDALRKLQAIDSLSKALLTYEGSRSNSSSVWPYLTIENSARFLEPYLDLANAAALTIQPIVPTRQRTDWEVYTRENQHWIQEDLDYRVNLQELHQQQNWEKKENITVQSKVRAIKMSPYIKNHVGVDMSPGNWVVWWQYAPVIADTYYLNFNRLALDGFYDEMQAVLHERKAQLSAMWSYKPALDFQSTADFQFMNELLVAGGNGRYQPGEPIGYIHYPVLKGEDDEEATTSSASAAKVVAVITATVYWKSYFQNILPDTVKGIHAVVTNTQGQSFTYQIQGKKASFLGMQDLHDTRFDKYRVSADYDTFEDHMRDYYGVPLDNEYISYHIHVYPTAELQDEYMTTKPIWYAAAMLGAFLFTMAVFVTYDCIVERRQRIVLTTAVKSTAVVSSLFPLQVRDRILEQARGPKEKNMSDKNRMAKRKLSLSQRSLEAHGNEEGGDQDSDGSNIASSDPIADFFPETTILFADIAGFTAWSSTREPKQVFVLLETVYSAFDRNAKRRQVFKVETIGDCYVAVTGLPQFRADHALCMARFAHDCIYKFQLLMRELETKLGLCDLALRVGVHSGPVTAGVLRGERSRFQLFGDTMNTAARMEQTGLPGRVQISQQCADLLVEAGKKHWITRRDNLVAAKGKGELETYWLNMTSSKTSTNSSTGEASTSGEGTQTSFDNDIINVMTSYNNVDQMDGEPKLVELNPVFTERTQRLIRWNVDVLNGLICQIVARREAVRSTSKHSPGMDRMDSKLSQLGFTVLDEVKEIVSLPKYNEHAEENRLGPSKVELSSAATEQLNRYVQNIAALYNPNYFHNFEHASHVTMSVTKLMARITEPQDHEDSDAATIHKRTYGIKSDPLTQFACVFSALIHDVQHTGVPNSQLIQENSNLAKLYKGRSVAEQNSVTISWDIFMDESFEELRKTICPTANEQKQFRQLVVNSVMATDILDKELKQLRDARWEKAFSADNVVEVGTTNADDNVNRKATIIIEHLIQASDVAHTMQHWMIYRRWNENFFMECSKAWMDGRSTEDPALSWFDGEIGFFDYYIIPLAKKLADCGVFGVSGDEYLNYARSNREEWAAKGKGIVADMVEQRSKLMLRHQQPLSMEQNDKDEDNNDEENMAEA